MWTSVPSASFWLVLFLSHAFSPVFSPIPSPIPRSVQANGTSTPRADRGPTIPATQATTLDGHVVNLPGDLPGRATVLILGFGRHSAQATTAWEKPIRTQLAHPPAIGFYDMAMLAEVPSFARGLVLRSIRKDVPDILKPNFLPLFDNERAWKQIAGYTPGQSEAAYVLLVDGAGVVRWSTHEAFSAAGFALLQNHLQDLARHLAAN